MKTIEHTLYTSYPDELASLEYHPTPRAINRRETRKGAPAERPAEAPLDRIAIVGTAFLTAAGYNPEYIEVVSAAYPATIEKIGEQALNGMLRPTDLLEWLPHPSEMLSKDTL